MKKLILTLAIAIMGIFSANAQVWMGGSAHANLNKNNTQITLSPEVGYSFTGTPWTIACAVNFGYNNNNATLDLSPYLRYSLGTLEKFAFFMDLTGDLGAVNNSGYRIALQPGVAWMATEHWTAAFRFAFLGWSHNYNDVDGFTMDFAAAAPGFGLYYNF